ncbi:MAG: phage tail protein [bacterium]
MADPFIGEIKMVGFNFAPRGWAFCDGQLLSISANTALFSLLGTMYGGDGRTTFGLPDLRGRVAIHAGQGPELSSYKVGAKSGVENVTLTTNQIPAHNHAASISGTIKCFNAPGNTNSPVGNAPSQTGGAEAYTTNPPNSDMHSGLFDGTASINNTGGGQAHENRQPFLAIRFCIALVGIFPSRN